MRLVATISVVICARIRPLDCISSPYLWRSIQKPQRPDSLMLP
jgi:hypothetical protein